MGSVLNLIKADLFRLRKSKAIIVLMIIAIVSTFLTAISLYLIVAVFGDLGGEEVADIIKGVLGSLIMRTALSSDILILAVVLCICIFCGTEFSHGTLRNKIIAGNSRIKIYFSTVAVNCIIYFIFFFALLIVSMIFSLLFFNLSYFTQSLAPIALSILPGLGVVCTTTFICMSVKSRTLSIVLSIVVIIVIPLVLSVIAISDSFSTLNSSMTEEELTAFFENGSILTQIISFNPYTYVDTVILNGLSTESIYSSLTEDLNTLSNTIIIKAVVIGVSYSTLFSLLGAFLFKRTDIK